MVDNRKKVIKKFDHRTETGYYNDQNRFLLHSYEDEPAVIYPNGDKVWWKDGLEHRSGDLPAVECGEYKEWWEEGKRYWIIENTRHFNKTDIFEKFKDKILKFNYDITDILTDMNIDFIYLGYNSNKIEEYLYFLILDDMGRNEAILRYG